MGKRFFGSSFNEVTADMINKRFEYLTNLYEMHNITTDEMFERNTSDSSFTITFGALKFNFVRTVVMY